MSKTEFVLKGSEISYQLYRELTCPSLNGKKTPGHSCVSYCKASGERKCMKYLVNQQDLLRNYIMFLSVQQSGKS